MRKKYEGLLQLVFAIAVILSVIYFSKEIEQLSAFGYLGVFLISMLSAATIIFPSPGWSAVVAMSPFLNPVYLGIAAGIGAAIGELTGYFAGKGVRKMLNHRIKESKRVEKYVRKYGPAAIFVFSLIPNPLFDIAGIAAGSVKMPWWQFLIACAWGRVIRFILLAYFGALTLGVINGLL